MTKLVVHIGEHKTGSTSIQDFLVRNSTALIGHPQKILFPQSGLFHGAHHHLAYAVKPEISSVAARRGLSDSSFRKDWRSLQQEIRNGHATLAVLSSETFENNDAEHLRDIINEHLQGLVSACKIILYIRPLIDLLVSRYSQLTANEDFPVEFEEFSAQCLTNPNLFWSQRLVPWFDAFGEENVSARGYIQSKMSKQDIVVDFCEHALSIKPDGMEIPSRKNTRNNAVVLAAMKSVKKAIGGASYDGTLRFRNAKHRQFILMAVLTAFRHRKDTFFFSQATVERMRERYLPDAKVLDSIMYAGEPVFSTELDKAVERSKSDQVLLDLAEYLGVDSVGCDKAVQQLVWAAEHNLAMHQSQSTTTRCGA